MQSGQCEKQLLKLGHIQRAGALIGLDEAFLHSRGNDGESGAVDGTRHSGQLRHHGTTVGTGFDGGDDRGELPLSASEPVDCLAQVVGLGG